MDVAERSRLEKLLGMLGSSFDGERANAARMISAMAERKKVTIPELVFGPGSSPRQDREQPRAKPKRPAQPEATEMLDALRGVRDAADDLGFVVTAWELQFCIDVAEKHSADYELSDKQAAVAQRIIDKVEKARKSGAAP